MNTSSNRRASSLLKQFQEIERSNENLELIEEEESHEAIQSTVGSDLHHTYISLFSKSPPTPTLDEVQGDRHNDQGLYNQLLDIYAPRTSSSSDSSPSSSPISTNPLQRDGVNDHEPGGGMPSTNATWSIMGAVSSSFSTIKAALSLLQDDEDQSKESGSSLFKHPSDGTGSDSTNPRRSDQGSGTITKVGPPQSHQGTRQSFADSQMPRPHPLSGLQQKEPSLLERNPCHPTVEDLSRGHSGATPITPIRASQLSQPRQRPVLSIPLSHTRHSHTTPLSHRTRLHIPITPVSRQYIHIHQSIDDQTTNRPSGALLPNHASSRHPSAAPASLLPMHHSPHHSALADDGDDDGHTPSPDLLHPLFRHALAHCASVKSFTSSSHAPSSLPVRTPQHFTFPQSPPLPVPHSEQVTGHSGHHSTSVCSNSPISNVVDGLYSGVSPCSHSTAPIISLGSPCRVAMHNAHTRHDNPSSTTSRQFTHAYPHSSNPPANSTPTSACAASPSSPPEWPPSSPPPSASPQPPLSPAPSSSATAQTTLTSIFHAVTITKTITMLLHQTLSLLTQTQATPSKGATNTTSNTSRLLSMIDTHQQTAILLVGIYSLVSSLTSKGSSHTPSPTPHHLDEPAPPSATTATTPPTVNDKLLLFILNNSDLSSFAATLGSPSGTKTVVKTLLSLPRDPQAMSKAFAKLSQLVNLLGTARRTDNAKGEEETHQRSLGSRHAPVTRQHCGVDLTNTSDFTLFPDTSHIPTPSTNATRNPTSVHKDHGGEDEGLLSITLATTASLISSRPSLLRKASLSSFGRLRCSLALLRQLVNQSKTMRSIVSPSSSRGHSKRKLASLIYKWLGTLFHSLSLGYSALFFFNRHTAYNKKIRVLATALANYMYSALSITNTLTMARLAIHAACVAALWLYSVQLSRAIVDPVVRSQSPQVLRWLSSHLTFLSPFVGYVQTTAIGRLHRALFHRVFGDYYPHLSIHQDTTPPLLIKDQSGGIPPTEQQPSIHQGSEPGEGHEAPHHTSSYQPPLLSRVLRYLAANPVCDCTQEKQRGVVPLCKTCKHALIQRTKMAISVAAGTYSIVSTLRNVFPTVVALFRRQTPPLDDSRQCDNPPSPPNDMRVSHEYTVSTPWETRPDTVVHKYMAEHIHDNFPSSPSDAPPIELHTTPLLPVPSLLHRFRHPLSLAPSSWRCGCSMRHLVCTCHTQLSTTNHPISILNADSLSYFGRLAAVNRHARCNPSDPGSATVLHTFFTHQLPLNPRPSLLWRGFSRLLRALYIFSQITWKTTVGGVRIAITLAKWFVAAWLTRQGLSIINPSIVEQLDAIIVACDEHCATVVTHTVRPFLHTLYLRVVAHFNSLRTAIHDSTRRVLSTTKSFLSLAVAHISQVFYHSHSLFTSFSTRMWAYSKARALLLLNTVQTHPVVATMVTNTKYLFHIYSPRVVSLYSAVVGMIRHRVEQSNILSLIEASSTSLLTSWSRLLQAYPHVRSIATASTSSFITAQGYTKTMLTWARGVVLSISSNTPSSVMTYVLDRIRYAIQTAKQLVFLIAVSIVSPCCSTIASAASHPVCTRFISRVRTTGLVCCGYLGYSRTLRALFPSLNRTGSVYHHGAVGARAGHIDQSLTQALPPHALPQSPPSLPCPPPSPSQHPSASLLHASPVVCSLSAPPSTAFADSFGHISIKPSTLEPTVESLAECGSLVRDDSHPAATPLPLHTPIGLHDAHTTEKADIPDEICLPSHPNNFPTSSSDAAVPFQQHLAPHPPSPTANQTPDVPSPILSPYTVESSVDTPQPSVHLTNLHGFSNTTSLPLPDHPQPLPTNPRPEESGDDNTSCYHDTAPSRGLIISTTDNPSPITVPNPHTPTTSPRRRRLTLLPTPIFQEARRRTIVAQTTQPSQSVPIIPIPIHNQDHDQRHHSTPHRAKKLDMQTAKISMPSGTNHRHPIRSNANHTSGLSTKRTATQGKSNAFQTPLKRTVMRTVPSSILNAHNTLSHKVDGSGCETPDCFKTLRYPSHSHSGSMDDC